MNQSEFKEAIKQATEIRVYVQMFHIEDGEYVQVTKKAMTCALERADSAGDSVRAEFGDEDYNHTILYID